MQKRVRWSLIGLSALALVGAGCASYIMNSNLDAPIEAPMHIKDPSYGNGNDFYDGGEGVDTARFLNIRQGVVLDLSNETAFGVEIGIDRVINIENVSGGAGDDILIGDGEDNLLDGDGGNDTLIGYLGNDILNGRSGDDRLFGGAGDDRFQFGRSSGHDLVMDFVAGEDTEDVLEFRVPGLSTFSDVMAKTRQEVDKTVIRISDKKSITLMGVKKRDLHQDDFAFM